MSPRSGPGTTTFVATFASTGSACTASVDAASIGQGVLRANDASIPVFVVGGAPPRGEVIAVRFGVSRNAVRRALMLLAQRGIVGHP